MVILVLVRGRNLRLGRRHIQGARPARGEQVRGPKKSTNTNYTNTAITDKSITKTTRYSKEDTFVAFKSKKKAKKVTKNTQNTQNLGSNSLTNATATCSDSNTITGNENIELETKNYIKNDGLRDIKIVIRNEIRVESQNGKRERGNFPRKLKRKTS